MLKRVTKHPDTAPPPPWPALALASTNVLSDSVDLAILGIFYCMLDFRVGGLGVPTYSTSELSRTVLGLKVTWSWAWEEERGAGGWSTHRERGQRRRQQDRALRLLSHVLLPSRGSWKILQFSSVQSLSRVRLFATPRTAARQPSLSIPTPGVYSNSCPLGRWCHPAISSSVIPFSSRLRLSQH